MATQGQKNRSCIFKQYAFFLCVKPETTFMKNGQFILCVLACFLLFSQVAKAQETQPTTGRNNMLGIRISSKDAAINNSITYKRFLNPALAVEGLFSFGGPAALGFLIEKHKPFGSNGLTWFWGAGAYAGFGSSRRFGAQGAVGLDFLLPTLPLNLSIDWKPELNFTKAFSFEPSAVGFSARFVF